MTAFKNSVKSISHGLLLVSRNTSGFKNILCHLSVKKKILSFEKHLVKSIKKSKVINEVKTLIWRNYLSRNNFQKKRERKLFLPKISWKQSFLKEVAKDLISRNFSVRVNFSFFNIAFVNMTEKPKIECTVWKTRNSLSPKFFPWNQLFIKLL